MISFDPSEASGPHLAGFVPPSLDDLNRTISGYEFLEFIDHGGMGAVYQARQRSLGRIVAVKVLPPSLTERKGFAARFKREAEALARLNHPNIVAVYDCGESADGCLYYAMELVRGSDLQAKMRSGELSAQQKLAVVMHVCEALQYAHSRGVVHRDIKPSNILIDERGRVKVADFGLAKIFDTGHQGPLVTTSGTALGTPEYVAPEVLESEKAVDHRADIYSLGVMLYEMLTGHTPKGAWEPPSRCGADRRLDDVVSRALQNDPSRRYQHVDELTSVLRGLVKLAADKPRPPLPASGSAQESGPEASTIRLPHSSPSRWSRGKAWLAASAAAAAIAAAFAAMKLATPDEGKPSASSSDAAAGAPAAAKQAGDQLALARWVFNRGGFVSVTTPSKPDPLTGDAHDLRTEATLPQGPFRVWRIVFGNVADFGDLDLADLVAVAEPAGTVTNLNLSGTSATAAGLSHLGKLNTLTSLNLRNTPAFAEEALPHLAACQHLQLLLVNKAFDNPSDTSRASVLELVPKLRDLLPGCAVHVE